MIRQSRTLNASQVAGTDCSSLRQVFLPTKSQRRCACQSVLSVRDRKNRKNLRNSGGYPTSPHRAEHWCPMPLSDTINTHTPQLIRFAIVSFSETSRFLAHFPRQIVRRVAAVVQAHRCLALAARGGCQAARGRKLVLCGLRKSPPNEAEFCPGNRTACACIFDFSLRARLLQPVGRVHVSRRQQRCAGTACFCSHLR